MAALRTTITLVLAAALAVLVSAATLSEVCTLEHVRAALPVQDLPGDMNIAVLEDSITVNAVTSYSLQPGTDGSKDYDFCNITFAYTHESSDDTVNVWYWLPSPDQFQGRYLSTGGGGYAITSGERALSGGLPYGAVAGTTDGGLGSWRAQLTDRILAADGVLDYDILFMFAYKAIHEMSVLGKQLAMNFYDSPSVYSYYTGCSEGGREGLSQIQRYGSQFDGAIIGAPAIRFAHLQVLHLFPPLVEINHEYFPSRCEISRIVTDVIEACDLLDGRADGVVSRTDLCMLTYNTTSAVGKQYSCDASSGGFAGGGPPGAGGATPAAKGTVSVEAAAIVQAIWDGMVDSQGRNVYVSFPPTAIPSEAIASYDTATREYGPSKSSLGVQWVNYFLDEIASNDFSFDNKTYDTLRDWVLEGMQKYADTLQTNWPNLEDFQGNGGKIIHYHGESDNGIPAASSILYYESVRKTMYPTQEYNESISSLDDWYRLYLVPGAGHCGPSPTQANGPFPVDALASLIDWVENGANPERLNATVSGGDVTDVNQRLCAWPLRPYWTSNGTAMDCVYDQESIDTWLPSLNSIPVTVW